MTKPRVKVETRLSQELKEGVKARLGELGYSSISALVRDLLSVVAFGYEEIPKNNSLPNIDGILEPVLSQSKLGAQKQDFFEFMTTPHEGQPNYLVISSRCTEEQFLADVIDLTGDYLTSDSLHYTMLSTDIRRLRMRLNFTSRPSTTTAQSTRNSRSISLQNPAESH
jgi:hypothetical protein